MHSNLYCHSMQNCAPVHPSFNSILDFPSRPLPGRACIRQSAPLTNAKAGPLESPLISPSSSLTFPGCQGCSLLPSPHKSWRRESWDPSAAAASTPQRPLLRRPEEKCAGHEEREDDGLPCGGALSQPTARPRPGRRQCLPSRKRRPTVSEPLFVHAIQSIQEVERTE